MKKIAIHGVPRSGTTWLGSIFDSHPAVNYSFQPLFSFRFKDFLNETSSKPDIDNFFDKISQIDDDFLAQTAQRSLGLVPYFEKEIPHKCIAYKEVRYHQILHNLFEKDTELFGVFIIRDPIEVLTSWINAPKEFNPEWKIEDEWDNASKKNLNKSEEFYGFLRWMEASRIFDALSKKYPDRVSLVNYAELCTDTDKIIANLFQRIGLTPSSQTHSFLRRSRAKTVSHPYSVFKSEGAQSEKKQQLPKKIQSEIRNRLSNDTSILKLFN